MCPVTFQMWLITYVLKNLLDAPVCKVTLERRGDYDAVPSMDVEDVFCTPFSMLLYLHPRIKSIKVEKQNFSQ